MIRVGSAFFLASALTILLADQACPDALDALVITSAVADLATTEAALRSPALRESNPFLQTPAARVGVKTLATVIVLSTARALEHRNHRGWSKGLRIACVVVWSGAAVNNAWRTRGTR